MSGAQFRRVKDLKPLRRSLSKEPLKNATSINAIFNSDAQMNCHATVGFGAALAISEESERAVFAGDWTGLALPLELLPGAGFFTPACPPEAMALVRRAFVVKEEWPCWYYLAPEGYGPGPWDELGPLTVDDVEFVAQYWHLGENPVEHLREKIAKHDSACVRIDGRPVSWAGLHYEVGVFANLGFGHTLEEHRRKGYASMVTKALVNRLAKRGMRATAHVIKENENSIKLCESLGFEVVGEATWAVIEPKGY